MNTTESLRIWLRECPAIATGERFNVDYMGQNPVEFTLFSSPTQMTYKTDILGNIAFDPIQELNFVFAALSYYSQDIKQNIDNIEFFSDVVKWICEQNAKHYFPEIDEGEILSIMPTLSPYVFDADSDSARYQIQLKVRYRRN